MPDQFTDQEKQLLGKFCTNVDSDVFALLNLPDVVKGTLFSRYSRSPKSLKRLLLDEFVHGTEIHVKSLLGEAHSDALLEIGKAEKFYERVLIQYGDDSVAELGGAHLALENISNLATKFIEDRRIGISPLEKSSRYVYFNEKVDGKYKFYRDDLILNSRLGDEYESACNLLFDTYTKLMEPMSAYFDEKFPKDENVSDRAHKSIIKAKVCDSLRGLLPASTLTNVGLFGNGRAFEYLITKMRASNLGEINDLGKQMHDELNKVFPVFIKRSFSKYGDQAVEYCNSVRFPAYAPSSEAIDSSYVKLVEFDQNGVDKIVSSILFAATGKSYDEALECVSRMSDAEKRDVIANYVGNRKNRRHRPGRAFENTQYLFEMCANFGAYRDLHRHRILTQERQLLTTFNGYDVPNDIVNAGYVGEFDEAMKYADQVFRELFTVSREHAQYVVPFAYRVRWYMRMNLREAYHLIELRSARQGHPDYRVIAQQMHYQIKSVHPQLAEWMKFVDMNDYDFERLESEKRIDEKMKRAGR